MIILSNLPVCLRRFLLFLTVVCSNSIFAHAQQSLDGIGNNPMNLGAANVPFCRSTIPAAFSDSLSAPSGLNRPSARLLSNIVSSIPSRLNGEGLSTLTNAWSQFLLDELVAISDSLIDIQAFPITVPCCDQIFDLSCSCSSIINYTRANFTMVNGVRQPINGRSGFLDASNIYGFNAVRGAAVRTFVNGRLRIDEPARPPLNVDGLPMSPVADARKQRLTANPNSNYQPGALALHGLLIAEHNALADQARATNPTWDDERLFQEARKLVIALVQSITSQQYLPPVATILRSPVPAYNASVNPCVDAFFATVAMPGLVLATSAVVYERLNADLSLPSGGAVQMAEQAFDHSFLLDGGIDPVLMGALLQPMKNVDLAMADTYRQHALGPSQPHDAFAVAIQRARDFGIPSYPQARRALALSVPTSFDALDTTPQIRELLRAAYANNISNLDALIGGLAESHAAPFAVGPLFRASLANQFQRMRDGDRFWYERVFASDPPTLQQLRTATLSDLISRHTSIPPVLPPNPFFTTSIASYVAAKSAYDAANPTPTLPMPAGASSSVPGGNQTGAVLPSSAYLWLTPKFGVSWHRFGNDAMQIALAVNTLGWFGLGLGQNMIDADFMIASITNGVVDAHDYAPVFHTKPPLDSAVGGIDNLEVISGREIGSWSYLTFRRPLAASDASDVAIKLDSPTPIIFAFSPVGSDTISYHGASRWTGLKIDFRYSPTDARALAASRAPVFLIHSVGMVLIFAFIVPVLILIPRYAKETSFWLKFHRNAAYMATTTTLPLAATAFGLTGPPSHLHHYVGFSICLLIIVALISGYVSQWWMHAQVGLGVHPKFSLVLGALKGFHFYFGYVVCGIGFYQMKLGMELFPLNPSEIIPDNVFWGVLGFWLTLAVLLEIFKKHKLQRYLFACCRNMSCCTCCTCFRPCCECHKCCDDCDEEAHVQMKDDLKDSLGLESGEVTLPLINDFETNFQQLIKSMGETYMLLPELSIAEFIERVQNGNRWVRLRHIILDIAPLTKIHPGGRAVLDAVIRSTRDIEPYLRGSDTVPAFPALKNTHSIMAWGLIKKFPVARLDLSDLSSLFSAYSINSTIPLTASSLSAQQQDDSSDSSSSVSLPSSLSTPSSRRIELTELRPSQQSTVSCPQSFE